MKNVNRWLIYSFDIGCVCATVAVGLICSGRIVGIGIGTIGAMVGVGRTVALVDCFFKDNMLVAAGLGG